jgi:hypothetical protein
MAARIAMIAITTRSSINVNASLNRCVNLPDITDAVGTDHCGLNLG